MVHRHERFETLSRIPHNNSNRKFNRRVVAVAYSGLCTFEFGVASELFGLARPELGVDWYDYQVVSTDRGPLRMIGGVSMRSPTDLNVLRTAGTIVLPGWRDIEEQPPDQLLEAIRVGHRNGARIMSICSGVFVLAATGLLDDQAATTHWRYTDRLAEMYPNIDVQPDVLYVDNGTTMTSAGSAAGIDLGLHLIRRDYGADIANRVARRLVLPPHRSGGQAQFIETPVDQTNDDAALQHIMAWAIAHIGDPITVTDLARACHLAPRTFARRFKTEIGVAPLQWIIHQRIIVARRYLETTTLSIDDIAVRSGLGTAENLRHHFAQELSTTPTNYRVTFQ